MDDIIYDLISSMEQINERLNIPGSKYYGGFNIRNVYDNLDIRLKNSELLKRIDRLEIKIEKLEKEINNKKEIEL